MASNSIQEESNNTITEMETIDAAIVSSDQSQQQVVDDDEDIKYRREVSKEIIYYKNRVLGKGNSTVYLGKFNFAPRKSKKCAVKRILKEDYNSRGLENSIEEILSEIKIWIQLTKRSKSNNKEISPIVRCFGFVQNDDFW